MVFREAFASQDNRRMCKHAERDHEAKKLHVLIDRLNRQIAEQGKAGMLKPPALVLPKGAMSRPVGRLSLLDS